MKKLLLLSLLSTTGLLAIMGGKKEESNKNLSVKLPVGNTIGLKEPMPIEPGYPGGEEPIGEPEVEQPIGEAVEQVPAIGTANKLAEKVVSVLAPQLQNAFTALNKNLHDNLKGLNFQARIEVLKELNLLITDEAKSLQLILDPEAMNKWDQVEPEAD